MKIKTSLDRELELPLKSNVLKENEEVVAVEDDNVELIVIKKKSFEILKVKESKDEKNTCIVRLPNYNQYEAEKEIRKQIILTTIYKDTK